MISIMKLIPAGEVKLPSTSPVWDLTKGLTEVFDDGKDMIVLDVIWFLEWGIGEADKVADGAQFVQRQRLVSALDSDPECAGWKDVKLLYIWPA